MTTPYLFDFMNDKPNASNSNDKAPKLNDNGVGGMKTPIKKNKRTVVKITMNSQFSEGKVLIDLPLKTVSEANCFEPWQVKHGRHKEQKRIVSLALKPLKDKVKLPCKIFLTRLAPHELDTFDNLPMSMKYIVDAICEIITGEYRAGKADSDKRISIACDQIKSQAYGVRVEITFA